MSIHHDAMKALTDILHDLARTIAALESAGLSETAQLLKIGKLDLEMQLHAVSDDELRALCRLIEEGTRWRGSHSAG